MRPTRRFYFGSSELPLVGGPILLEMEQNPKDNDLKKVYADYLEDHLDSLPWYVKNFDLPFGMRWCAYYNRHPRPLHIRFDKKLEYAWTTTRTDLAPLNGRSRYRVPRFLYCTMWGGLPSFSGQIVFTNLFEAFLAISKALAFVRERVNVHTGL